MNREDKTRIIDELINTRGKLQRAQFELALEGEDTRALDDKLEELDAAIAEIRRALHEQWQGRVRELEQDLKLANRRAQGRIRDIRKRVKRAERIVALVGDVEEIIGKVRGMLP